MLLVSILCPLTTDAGTLSCSTTTSCPSGVVMYRMSSTTNAHAGVPPSFFSTYPNLVCCTGVAGLSGTCSGATTTLLKLTFTDNAHAAQPSALPDFANYPNSACISVPTGGSVSIGYQTSNCAGYDTTLGSMESATNSHIGDANAYPTKICASATGSQSLTFSISDNTIGFGTLLSSAAQFATGDTLGASVDTTDSHTLSASTNVSGGYSISLNGTTLTSGVNTITAMGGTATASSVGTKQFGLRIVSNSGTGVAVSPYNTGSWAFDVGTFPNKIVTGTGDSSTSVLGMRYISNISASTPSGSYTSVLTYVMTVNF